MCDNHEILNDEKLTQIAHRFALLAEPMRLKLLRELMDGERNVNDLTEATGGTQTNVSRHLKTMTEEGLLGRRRDGLQVFYSVADPSVFDLCAAVCGRKTR